ncbi:hypothetical protein ABEB36_004750 [Hypothenemus hampei]|uniref:Uncharacterized protein n=1 Tax=Hypothenemus hampei TaxID=57062 RepID=A0ABD1F7Y8_HYPHA
MAATDTTINDALRQIIDPATPKFVQPPIFRPASDSPSSFLLGYERAAIDIIPRTISRGSGTQVVSKIPKQREVTSGPFYRRKQGHTEEVKHYYYELLALADEVDVNMPFVDFLAQFEKGLHSKFRQLYYILREDDMGRGTLRNIVQKLHRSQESLAENDGPLTSVNNHHPRFNNRNNWNNRYQGSFRDDNPSYNYTSNGSTVPEIRGKEIPIPGPVPSKPHGRDPLIIKDDQIITLCNKKKIFTGITVCSDDTSLFTQLILICKIVPSPKVS